MDEDPYVILSSGPELLRQPGDDDPPYRPPRVRLGFTPPRTDREPLTWEGDSA